MCTVKKISQAMFGASKYLVPAVNTQKNEVICVFVYRSQNGGNDSVFCCRNTWPHILRFRHRLRVFRGNVWCKLGDVVGGCRIV